MLSTSFPTQRRRDAETQRRGGRRGARTQRFSHSISSALYCLGHYRRLTKTSPAHCRFHYFNITAALLQHYWPIGMQP
jgi:hypothetical protein